MRFKDEERGSVVELNRQEAEQFKALKPAVVKWAGGAVKWVERKKSMGGWVDMGEWRVERSKVTDGLKCMR